VVTVKGDTLRGFINQKGWDINPGVISFKSSPKANVMKFSVGDITYFSVGKDARYQRYVGLISMDNVSEDHMIEYRDTTYKVDSVFLEVLQKGKNIALYGYSDALKPRFFVGEYPDYAPVELVYRLYYNPDQADFEKQKGRTVNENTFMKQLFTLATKYNVVSEKLMKEISYYGYKEYYLVQVSKMINEGSK
ncbi:MAG: hypothetical protein ACHQHN_16105, partial [Sphingobacteriales bacterium]